MQTWAQRQQEIEMISEQAIGTKRYSCMCAYLLLWSYMYENWNYELDMLS